MNRFLLSIKLVEVIESPDGATGIALMKYQGSQKSTSTKGIYYAGQNKNVSDTLLKAGVGGTLVCTGNMECCQTNNRSTDLLFHIWEAQIIKSTVPTNGAGAPQTSAEPTIPPTSAEAIIPPTSAEAIIPQNSTYQTPSGEVVPFELVPF
ncbi:hypothetical protein NG798_26540 [Ancylothrix sp. C2]|uniref:hypothetical protein n=1 Tax=Ancylothrix sp. D3o TaxID=2953691 RepID=UPI0021BB77F7|nr:hypothetical protein [Ancylothrix sp. D3o]MCT7953362.1 hypothetical protein [Ancylothrix sp. D3o]